jgi:hypothetical protein
LRLILASALVSVASLGCTQIPKTPPYAPTVGAKTCSALAEAAAERSAQEWVAGAAIAVAGLTGVATGILLGPDTAPNAEWHERNRYVFVIVPSTVVAAIGVGIIMGRAHKTEQLAAQATTTLVDGRNEADRYLYYECVSARADWSGNRSEVARIHVNLFKESLAASMAAQETASTAQTQAQSATSLAADAKVMSVKATQVASASAEATKSLATATEKLIEATPKPEAKAPILDAKAALSGVKGSLAPKPDPTPRLQGPPSPPLQQQR